MKAADQEATKRCRLSWLTSSALGVSANEYSCAHGAKINFGDITPYLTYAADTNGLFTEAGLEEQSGLIPRDPAVRPPGPLQLLVGHFHKALFIK